MAVGLSHLALSQLLMCLQGPDAGLPMLWPAAGLSLAAVILLPPDRWVWALTAVALAEVAGDLAWGYCVPLTLG